MRSTIRTLLVASLALVGLASCASRPPAEPPGLPPLKPPTATPTPPAPAPPHVEPPRAVLPPKPTPPPTPPARPDLEPPPLVLQALDYFLHATRLPPRRFSRELELVRKAYATSGSDLDRVRLALLLTLPNGRNGDDTQALELLEPLARDRTSELHALALLLVTHVGEQRRLSREAGALERKLKQMRALEREMLERSAAPRGPR